MHRGSVYLTSCSSFCIFTSSMSTVSRNSRRFSSFSPSNACDARVGAKGDESPPPQRANTTHRITHRNVQTPPTASPTATCKHHPPHHPPRRTHPQRRRAPDPLCESHGDPTAATKPFCARLNAWVVDAKSLESCLWPCVHSWAGACNAGLMHAMLGWYMHCWEAAAGLLLESARVCAPPVL